MGAAGGGVWAAAHVRRVVGEPVIAAPERQRLEGHGARATVCADRADAAELGEVQPHDAGRILARLAAIHVRFVEQAAGAVEARCVLSGGAVEVLAAHALRILGRADNIEGGRAVGAAGAVSLFILALKWLVSVHAAREFATASAKVAGRADGAFFLTHEPFSA